MAAEKAKCAALTEQYSCSKKRSSASDPSHLILPQCLACSNLRLITRKSAPARRHVRRRARAARQPFLPFMGSPRQIRRSAKTRQLGSSKCVMAAQRRRRPPPRLRQSSPLTSSAARARASARAVPCHAQWREVRAMPALPPAGAKAREMQGQGMCGGQEAGRAASPAHGPGRAAICAHRAMNCGLRF